MHPASPHPTNAAPTQPDPNWTPSAQTMPENLWFLLGVVEWLIAFGRYCVETLDKRANHPLFPILAAVFGTHKVRRIHDHLRRGLYRAIALERYLIARARKGREIAKTTPPHLRTQEENLAPAGPLGQSRTQRVPRSAGTPEVRRPPVDPDNPYTFHTPSMAELAREVASRPIGRTLDAIVLDLGIASKFCTADFWDALTHAQEWFGGRGQVVHLVETRRRENFEKERSRLPKTWDCDWHEHRQDVIRPMLGCLAGEYPPEVKHPLQHMDWPPPLPGCPSIFDPPPDESPPPDPPALAAAA